MAAIQAIEAKSVHQIQSGQVIVDLCSVVKELVENSLDAGATTIEIRFKNNGLDAIEVQDNGSGISPSNYANVALKHYTSKLASYDDLSSLDTFGFRGEALSSLCALSSFTIVTAQAGEAPKGTRLDFDMMGALKSQTTVACQRGTIARVENLFNLLPVRRKELSKNIKREYGKVIGLLNAYACIGVGVKFTVKNVMPKGKSMVVFSTKGNHTTRENIANVYGAKTLPALVALDLKLDLEPSLTQAAQDGPQTMNVTLRGHISKPVFGEGRQTPDRQMFFVNGRPCGLPQIAKAINEVYRSFNVSQSPFVFADFLMDANAYDVNVSPDKRTILLHNAARLIERVKACLTELFDNHEQTVPQSQFQKSQASKLPASRKLPVQRDDSHDSESDDSRKKQSKSDRPKLRDDGEGFEAGALEADDGPAARATFADHFRNQASTREEIDEATSDKREARAEKDKQRRAERAAKACAEIAERNNSVDEFDDVREMAVEQIPDPPGADDDASEDVGDPVAGHVRDFNALLAGQRPAEAPVEKSSEAPISSIVPVLNSGAPGPVQNAFDRMRPKKTPAQLATITVDDETTTRVIGTRLPKFVRPKRPMPKHKGGIPVGDKGPDSLLMQFSQRLQRFGAEGAQASPSQVAADESEQDEDPSSADEAQTTEASVDGDEESLDEHESIDSAEDKHEEHESQSDSDYVDDKAKKAEEEATVKELIAAAEQTKSKLNHQWATKALKGGLSTSSTRPMMTFLEVSVDELASQMRVERATRALVDGISTLDGPAEVAEEEQESRLLLTVSKADFGGMEIVGQFNLGFIIAVRRAAAGVNDHDKDELFIIDQHASDEKFNFERLQAETTVGNQRMVRPVTLDLTAVEEEIVLEHPTALEKNGFIIETDTTGAQPVGRRCTLLSLPLSKEVVFDTRDLDELIHLLSETPMLGTESAVPRPSRTRKLFAMRACRSSIMIGKTLSKRQMQTVVAHMGQIDKPWNCPHGRPTMRHLTSLDGIKTWEEGDGVLSDVYNTPSDAPSIWSKYLSDA